MSYSFINDKAGKITVKHLTFEFCQKHCDRILKIVNIIPHIFWTSDDLFSQDEDFYRNKWNYSYVILDRKNKIIGVLISYFRISDEKHIFDSLYLHRFAIAPEFQNMGIGKEVLRYFITTSYQSIPWLLNISVQTNDSPDNEYVIKFYNNLGFRKMYRIPYPNKVDWLMLIEKHNIEKMSKINQSSLKLRHPRLSMLCVNYPEIDICPIIYFSSTNEKKKEIVKFIFHNYNINVNFTKAPIELVEPQVESPDIEEERKLVSIPLKNASRFLNSNVIPYVIEDTMLFIEYFNRNNTAWELPGLDTKRWLRQLGLSGLLDIMGNTKKRKAKFVSQTGAYIKASTYCYGRGEITGSIAEQIPEINEVQYGTYPYFFHLIFIPDGSDKTLAEMDMHEYSKYDYMRKSIIQLIQEMSQYEEIEQPLTLFDY